MVETLPPAAETAATPTAAYPHGVVEALATVLTDDSFRTVRELLLVANWLTERSESTHE